MSERALQPRSLRPLMLVLGAACLLSIWGGSLLVAHSSLLTARPRLVGSAVLLDLTLSAACCHWLLSVRFGGLPAWTILPVLAAGLGLSRWIPPTGLAHAGVLPVAVAALVEAAVLVLLLVRITRFKRGFSSARRVGADYFAAIEAGCVTVAPGAPFAAAWIRLEFEVWWLFFCGWFLRPRVAERGVAFSHHKDVGWFGIAGAVALLLLVESVLLHLVLAHLGYATLLWLALGAHVYGFIWLVGDAQALRVYRSLLRPAGNGTAAVLDVRVGLRARALVPVASIADIKLGTWDAATPGAGLARVAGAANLQLTLRCPVEFRAMLRQPTPISRLLLQVDDPQALQRAIQALVTQKS